jgi:hypothetical protein
VVVHLRGRAALHRPTLLLRCPKAMAAVKDRIIRLLDAYARQSSRTYAQMQEAQEAARLAFDDLQRAVMSVPATLSIKELTEAVKVTHREITRRRSSVSYSAESPTEARFRIELANVYGPPTYVNVTVDFEGQHTIKWSRHVRVVHASGICEHGVRARRLRPGKCNLYTYPAITYEVTAAMCLSCRPTPLSALCIRQPARPLYHRVTSM